jgi:hypothetical protein
VTGQFCAPAITFQPSVQAIGRYIINFNAAVRIIASNGASRIIGPGEIFLVEDAQGKGHVLQAEDDKFRVSVFVTLD